jgi:hypothetical protein
MTAYGALNGLEETQNIPRRVTIGEPIFIYGRFGRFRRPLIAKPLAGFVAFQF